MSKNDELIQQFMQITGCDDEVAESYIERAGCDLESAVALYFSDGDEANFEEPPQEPIMETNNLNVSSAMTKDVKKPASNVHTISSMRDRKDEQDNKGQAFYVGGSEHGGGQQVIGPPLIKKPPNVDDLFRSAQEHGAEVLQKPTPGASSSSKSNAFAGSGYRLGDSAPVGSSLNAEQDPEDSNAQIVKVTLWSNGFTVDDGPLRSLGDPESAEFARLLSMGQIPGELVKKYKMKRIELDMENKTDEEYKAPDKPKIVPFQGTGMMLGSPAPKLAQSSDAQQSEPIPKQKSPIRVDENAPTTQLQIRLANNQREVLRLNHTHTIGDIRGHLISQFPEYSGHQFNLMTTFPNKVLSDESATVSESNLLNAQIVQRLV